MIGAKSRPQDIGRAVLGMPATIVSRSRVGALDGSNFLVTRFAPFCRGNGGIKAW